MPMDYSKALQRLKEAGITTYQIRNEKILSEGTLTKLRNNQCVTTDTICTLCALLHCQPGDILEYIEEEHDS